MLEFFMPRPHRSTHQIMRYATELRHDLTPVERKLWTYLRNDQLGVNFRRQHAIGSYIADFCCIEKKLIIDLDGSQHLEQQEYDQMRTAYLESLGFRVLRFWNKDVLNDLDGVVCVILENLDNPAW